MTRKGKVVFKTEEEIELIRSSCMLVSKVLAEVATHLKQGVTAEKLDRLAEQMIRDHGATPGFKGYGGFPATLCISTNDAVVHGIPSTREFQDEDIVSIDCGVFMNGFFGDAAYTFALGNVKPTVMELLKVTKASLYAAINNAVSGKRLGDVSFAVQELCEKKYHFGVVRELVGHGIGRELHEAPEVPNYGKRGKGQILREGLVIAIEPMVNLGKRDVRTAKDGWTIITKDNSPAAHYEHTIAVKPDKADILSNHTLIEEAESKNPNLKVVEKLELHT